MNKKITRVLLFSILFIFGMYYTYHINYLVDDELFNYGFSYSLIKGLVPYKDFNMIVPYFPHLLLSLFILILGNKLIVYHIVINLIIVTYTYILYKKIGYSSIVIYLLSYYYPYTYYNMFSLLLLFILLSIEDNDNKYIGFIIGCLFLTKQTLGILLIPYLYYSKNKIKSFITFIIPILIFTVILIYNNTLYNFINYCFLGMFDFSHSNNTGFNSILLFELFIIVGLIITLIIYKKKDIFYVLMYQIIALPIVNTIHFIIVFIPVIYLIIKYYINDMKYYKVVFIISSILFTIFNVLSIRKEYPGGNSNYKFMNNRYMSSNIYDYIITVSDNYINEYKDYDLYVLGTFSYMVKLNLDIPINKYDIINNGNMGYKGEYKYIDEIDSNCKNNKCLFIVSGSILNKNSQVNKSIIDYVDKNYSKIYGGDIVNYYLSEKK